MTAKPLVLLFPGYDWSPFFGGWDMSSLLAACAAGAAPFAVVVIARVGLWIALDVVRWAKRVL
jgi:hypothetical protein